MLYNSPVEAPLSEKKFSIIQEISTAILSIDNITAVANLILDFALGYTDAQKGSLMLTDDSDELYILASRGIDIDLATTYRVRKGEGIAGTVAENGLPILVEDIEKDERFKKGKRDRYITRSFISCPLISKSKLLGVININDKKDNSPFTEDEFSLVKVIANQASVALENAFLMSQLRMKAGELEEMNRKLIEGDVEKTEFLARISHELRTPLNSIKGAVFYLQETDKTPKSQQQEFLHIVSDETGKLIHLVENLLDFVRLEDEAKLIKKSIIDLPALLEEACNAAIAKTALETKKLELKLDVKKGISTIVGDRIKVVQLFLSLIAGLSYYLEHGDSIDIAAHDNDAVRVYLTLSRRLPDTVVSNLFHSRNLFQDDHNNERLKLYLGWKIAEAHRWALTVENKDKTTVILSIPKSSRQEIEAVSGAAIDIFTDLLSELLDIDTCSIMLADELTGDLTIASSRGLDADLVRRTRIRFGDRISGWVALEGKPLLVENIENDPRFERNNISQYNTKSLLSLPLKIEDKVKGVINLNNKKNAEIFTARDLAVASVLSERIAFFLEKLYSGEYKDQDVKRSLTSLENLAKTIKKYEKKQNCFAELMLRLMEKLSANEEDKKLAAYIVLIYDLGLATIDHSILSKEKLLKSDVRILKGHPRNTIGLLGNFEISPTVKKAIIHHHERFDGTGYPDQLKGEDIPFLSRVLSVVDAFCAMTSDRPYRKAHAREEALQEIQKGAGSVYDPTVVEAFQEVLAVK
jgi:HD-GYP domain-containing protein (c-di-GMP phosphodiesterase class II)/signal transduction histidine kinase